MAKPHIKDILIEFKGDELTKYGLFPLIIWYLMDVIKLPEYFKHLTVKSKRNTNKNKGLTHRKPKFNEIQMSMGLITIILLGIERLRKINDVLSTETIVKNLLDFQSSLTNLQLIFFFVILVNGMLINS